jgi:zinc/manganese transport system substrate-binding protein
MSSLINRRLFLYTALFATPGLIGSRAAPARHVGQDAERSDGLDLADGVGGDRVDAISLVGSNGDAHVYEPTPNDVRTLAGAAIWVSKAGSAGWKRHQASGAGE